MIMVEWKLPTAWRQEPWFDTPPRTFGAYDGAANDGLWRQTVGNSYNNTWHAPRGLFCDPDPARLSLTNDRIFVD